MPQKPRGSTARPGGSKASAADDNTARGAKPSWSSARQKSGSGGGNGGGGGNSDADDDDGAMGLSGSIYDDDDEAHETASPFLVNTKAALGLKPRAGHHHLKSATADPV